MCVCTILGMKEKTLTRCIFPLILLNTKFPAECKVRMFFLPQLVFSIYNCDSGQTDRRVAAYRFFYLQHRADVYTHTHTQSIRKKRMGSSGAKRVTSVGSGSWRLLSDWIGRSLGLDICVQGIYSILCEIENLERMLFIFLKTWKTPRVELDVFILTESSGGVKGKIQGCFCVVLEFLRLWTKASGSPDVTSQMNFRRCDWSGKSFHVQYFHRGNSEVWSWDRTL